MSTSGGSRGERNAKPKFQTIDINTLHRSSRGETSEPSKQNSQAVRKPGMQCLGKVPSARRPANLPSLKAETSTPAEQQASWGGGVNTENQIATQHTQPLVVNSAQTTPSVAPTNISSSSSTSVAVPINQPLTNSQNSNSSNTSVTNHHHHHHHHNTPSNISNSQSASSTWSSVATGHVPEQTGQPPLYQSPQFQHEFPSLDGSTATGSKSSHQQHQHSIQQQHVSTGQSGNSGGGHGGNGGMTQQTHEMSLRPQTNSGNWMQQQQPHQQQSQSSGNGNRGGENIGNGPNSQQGQGPQNQIPLPFQFILPQFMMRGETGGSGSQTGSAGGQNFGLPQNQNYSQNHSRPRSQPGAQSQIMYDPNFYGAGGGGGGHQNMPPRRHQQPQKRPQQEDRSSSLPANEPEIIHQRPIIKEEELERLDSLVKDDGWANPDNIDYNKKLEFSDDETCDDDNRPVNNASNKMDKKMHQQIADNEKEEEKRAAWREREKDRLEHDRLERERNEKNERDRNLNISNTNSSNIVDKDRDRASQSQQLLQQNGHRNEQDFTSDNRFNNDRRNNNINNSDLLEKKKFSDMDSTQQKRSGQPGPSEGVKPLVNTSILKRTPSDRDFGDDKRSVQQKSSEDFRSQMSGDRDRDIRDRDRGGIDKDRGFGRDRENYRNERDVSSRERDNFRMDSRDREREMGRDGGGAGILFSKQFQSNLPPRFLKQQMERHNTGSGNYMPGGGTRNNATGSNNFHQNNDKNIPFAQQYDARYIHSNYKSQQQQQAQLRGGEAIRRNPSDEMILNRRRRGDSEDDDRFSSGRESIGRNSNSGGGGGGQTPQLARSISDSSQRKTSVSSEENHRIERSESRELSQLAGSPPATALTSAILTASSTVTTTSTIINTTSWADEIELERGVKLEMANNNNSNLNNLINNNLINNKTETNDNFLLSKESTSNQQQQQHDEPIKQILQRSNSSNNNSCNVSNSSSSSTHNSSAINLSTSDAFNKETSNNVNFPKANSPEPQLNQGFVKEKSPKPWVDSVPDLHDSKLSDKSISSDNCDDVHRKSLESIPETKPVSIVSNEKEKFVGSSSNLKNHSNENLNLNSEQKHGGIKRISSSNQVLSSSSNRGGGNGGHMNNMGNRPPPQRDNNRGGGYSNYRSWNHQTSRGGRSTRAGRYESHNWTDTGSDGSDIDEEYLGRRNDRSPKVPRKDGSNQRYESSRSGGSGGGGGNMGGSQHNKEGFAPRGEPSRRGRGGGNTAPNSFRRGGGISTSTKRIEGYGPPNAKSPFSHSDEKSSQSKENLTEDKTKLNQIALTSGLMSNKAAASGHSNASVKKDDKVSGNTCAPAAGNNSTKSAAIENKKLSPPKITQQPSQQNAPSAKSPTTPTGQIPSNNKPESQNIKKEEKGVKKEEPLPQRTQHASASAVNKPKEQTKQQVQSMNQVQNNPNNQISKSTFGGPNNQQSQMNKSANKQQPMNNQNMQNAQRQQQQQQQQQQQNVKLPPRFMKQQQMVNRSNSSGSTSDSQSNTTGGNAWEKPLISSTLQDMSPGNLQNQEPNDNDLNKDGSNKTDNSKQPLLDGTTPPVTTIIFENTNYKTPQQAPIKRQQNSPIGSSGGNNVSTQMQQGVMKAEDMFKNQGSQVQQNTILNMIDVQQQVGTPDSITSALSNMTFPSTKLDAEYEKDMKLAFTFDTDLSQLTDEKTANSVNNTGKNAGNTGGLCMPRTMHSVTSAQSLMHPSTADLNMKIASVKKVWETPAMPTVLEHNQPDDHSGSHLASNFVTSHQPHLHQFVQHGNMVAHALSPGPSYSTSFGPDQSALEHFVKQDGAEQDYSGQQHSVGQNSHSHQNPNIGMVNKHAEALATNANVCKVKPNQQQIHQSGLAGLSPPPLQQGTLQTAPQYYPPTQFANMSAIPSPPAVVFNSSMASQGGLYTPFQIDAGRSQFSQYPTHYGTSNPQYNTYMQTPPNIQAGPTADMYQNLAPQYRMPQSVQNTYNQTHQLNNPSTVLISSSSNSLMSASVKPSSQQIGAIGSKAAAVGHPAIGQQYMNMYTHTQQGPPMQSNSYYSNSAGSQGAAFFGGPGAAAAQSYGLQATGIFGGPGGPAPSNGPPQQQVAGFSSPFLNSSLLATTISPYRGGPTSQPTAYLKSNQPQSHIQDPTGRQIKSPLNSDGGINLKQPPPQTSPPHHKNYPPSWELQNQVLQQQQQQQVQQQPPPNLTNRNNGGGGLSGGGGGGNNSGRSSQQSQQQQQQQQQQQNVSRYIAPIQRPTNYPQQHQQQNMMQSQNTRNPRMNVSHTNSGPNKHYTNPNVGGTGRGTHGSNQTEQTAINKVTLNQDKSNLDGQSSGGVANSQDTSKDDGQKE